MYEPLGLSVCRYLVSVEVSLNVNNGINCTACGSSVFSLHMRYPAVDGVGH